MGTLTPLAGFVRWAMMQVEAYAEIFRRQVYGIVDQDPKVVAEAVDITMSSASQLKDVGLDLTFFLQNLLKVNGEAGDGPGTCPRLLSATHCEQFRLTFFPSSRSLTYRNAGRRPRCTSQAAVIDFNATTEQPDEPELVWPSNVRNAILSTLSTFAKEDVGQVDENNGKRQQVLLGNLTEQASSACLLRLRATATCDCLSAAGKAGRGADTALAVLLRQLLQFGRICASKCV